MTSPVTPVPPPDVELLLVKFIRQFLPAGATVATEWPDGYDGTQTFVMVDRQGGAGYQQALAWSDEAEVQISYCGPNKGAAQDLMNTIRPYVAQAWLYQVPGGVFQDALETTGPAWLADPDYSKAGRYLVQNRVTVHP